ncbi:MAG: hypothetical protein R2770_07870 [Acidimicrobiales bacterium]
MTRKAAVTALVLLIAVLSACSDSDDSSSETTFATSTSEATGTTEADASTTTAASQTTTTEANTTTTSAAEAETTTTTTPPTTVDPGPTGLSLHGGGLGPVGFGRDVDTVLEYMGGIFGPATEDSGWVDSFSGFGTCPGSEVRGVTYGSLQLLFGGPDDDRTFFSWAYFDHGNGDVFGLRTPLGIGLGSSPAEIADAYPDAEFDEGDESLPPSARFGDMWATLDADAVTYLSGGLSCGE